MAAAMAGRRAAPRGAVNAAGMDACWLGGDGEVAADADERRPAVNA
eukprot:gene8473-2336_t